MGFKETVSTIFAACARMSRGSDSKSLFMASIASIVSIVSILGRRSALSKKKFELFINCFFCFVDIRNHKKAPQKKFKTILCKSVYFLLNVFHVRSKIKGVADVLHCGVFSVALE
jgi:hypothetical protein